MTSYKWETLTRHVQEERCKMKTLERIPFKAHKNYQMKNVTEGAWRMYKAKFWSKRKIKSTNLNNPYNNEYMKIS